MRRLTILTSVLALLAATVLAARSEKMSWNFDADKLGTIAKGFTNEAGKWGVVADDTAPSKPNVLAQLAKSTEPTFNLTLIKNSSSKGCGYNGEDESHRG